jgi:hypothetical protein
MRPQIERCPEKSEGGPRVALTVSSAVAARHLSVLVFEVFLEYEWQSFSHPRLVVAGDFMN